MKLLLFLDIRVCLDTTGTTRAKACVPIAAINLWQSKKNFLHRPSYPSFDDNKKCDSVKTPSRRYVFTCCY